MPSELRDQEAVENPSKVDAPGRPEPRIARDPSVDKCRDDLNGSQDAQSPSAPTPPRAARPGRRWRWR